MGLDIYYTDSMIEETIEQITKNEQFKDVKIVRESDYVQIIATCGNFRGVVMHMRKAIKVKE